MQKSSYLLSTLLVVVSMLMSVCGVTPILTEEPFQEEESIQEEEPFQETACDLAVLSLDAPYKMVAGHAEYISIQGSVMGEECEAVEILITADGETILADAFEVSETDSFYAYAQILPATEVQVHAVTNTGHELMRAQQIEVIEEAAVPRVDLVIDAVEMNFDEERYEIFMSVERQTEELLKGMIVCMAPCVEESYYSLRVSSSDISVENGQVAVAMLPTCLHPTFITCRAINDDADLPNWAVMASAPATTLVNGLEEADVGEEEIVAAQAWAESIAPLYPFATASSLLSIARDLDLTERVIQMDITDAQDPSSEVAEGERPFVRVMVGRGWQDLQGSRNLAFFFVPGHSSGILPPEYIPPVSLDPGEDIPLPPDESEGRDPLKELGLENMDDLADPQKLRGLRSAVEEMTNPEGDSSAGRTPLGSPFGADMLPRDPRSMTPDERFRSVLGSAWTNFARSLNAPPAGHRGPVSSSDPTYSGGWFDKVMDGLSLVGEAIGGAFGGATAAISTLWTVGSGLHTATSGPGAVYNCDNLGSGSTNCHSMTDAAATHYDPNNTQHGTPGNFCKDAMAGQDAHHHGECLKKTTQKWKDKCENDPNHPNCGKYCDKYPNSPSCKQEKRPTPKPDEPTSKPAEPTAKPKKPKGDDNAKRCDPDVNPDCDDMLDPTPEDFLKGEKHVLNITLKVCSSTESKVMPGQHCQVENRARIALAAKMLEASLCKKWAEVDAKCERRSVIAMRPIIKHRPDPVSPDPSD